MHKRVARAMSTIILVAGFLLAYGDSFDPAFACSCVPPRPIQEAYETSVAVFSGKVARIDADQFGRMAIFYVDTTWKGVSKDTVKVLTAAQSSACGYKFEEGRSYIVYAYSGGEDSSLKTSSCSRTASAENALEHFMVLGAGYAPTETGVRDRVVIDNGINSSILAIIGIGGAVVATIAYMTLRKRNKAS